MSGSELKKRVLTGLVIGVVIIGAALGGVMSTSLLVLCIAIGSGLEFFRIQSPHTGLHHTLLPVILNTTPVILLIAMQLFSSVFLQINPYGLAMGAITIAFIVFLILQLRAAIPQLERRIFTFTAAAFCITLPAVFALFLCGITPRILLGIFILIWASDVFAYFGGSMLGKQKLLPAISPKKTWEGFGFGLIAAVIAGWGMSFYIPEITLLDWVMTGVLVAVFGTLGDLLQSVIKRAAGVKDSGHLLPGHGGIWDRFDSFLGCMPVVGVYLLFL